MDKRISPDCVSVQMVNREKGITVKVLTGSDTGIRLMIDVDSLICTQKVWNMRQYEF